MKKKLLILTQKLQFFQKQKNEFSTQRKNFLYLPRKQFSLQINSCLKSSFRTINLFLPKRKKFSAQRKKKFYQFQLFYAVHNIIVKCFFSFCNIFCYTSLQHTFFSTHFFLPSIFILRVFYIVCNCILAFIYLFIFFFNFGKTLISFTNLFLVVFLCYLGNIQLMNLQTFSYMWKNI